jgi:trigger factor
LKITTEDLGDRQVLLTIEVDEERVESELRDVAQRVARQHNIPGFRRGRAPYHVILRRFGREALLRETLDDLGQDVIAEALKSEELELYGQGSLEDVQLDPLVFKLRVPLRPLVDLGDYRELRVEVPVVTVDEEEIDAELERLRQANAILGPAGDRPAQMGDAVTLDVNADVGDEPYIHKEAYSMELGAEDDSFAPGFSEQVVGMKTGEEKNFTLVLPGDEKSDGDLTGQEATFTVTLREIKSRILPDLDDDLARTVGDFDTLEELRQEISRQLEEKAQHQADQEYTKEMLEALVAGATIEYPPDLIKDQIDSRIKDLEKRLEDQGITLDDSLKLRGQTEEAFRDSLRPQAEQSVARSLALSELAHQEKLDVEEEEVNQRIAAMSALWGERASEVQQMLSAPEGARSVASNLLADKTIQRLVAIAKGKAPPLEKVDEEGVEEPSEEPDEAPGASDAAEAENVKAESSEPESD